MRKLSKILALVLVLMMTFAVVSALSFTSSAASQPEYLYLTPSANWKQSNARFAAYFFGNGETWVSMTDKNGDGVYEVKVPTAKVYPNVIFCRMNPSASANNWNNKWNQTSDLVIPTSGANHYTVKEGTWDKGGGTWSTFGSTCAHTNLGPAATCTTPQECKDCGDPVVSALGHTYNAAHLCTRCNEQASFTVAGSGAHLGTEWDTGNTANDMTFADGVYTKVYTNVAAGSYLLKVARDHDWGTAYPSADKAYTVATAGSTVTVTLKGTTVTVTVDAPHTHSYEEVVTAPTFDAEGYTTYTCSCGDSYVGNKVPALAAVAQIGDVKYSTLAEALEAAKSLTGDVVVEIYDKVTLNTSLSGSYDSITFVGKDTDAEIYLEVQGYITATGKTVSFEDLTLSKSAGGFITNAGFMNVAFGVYDVNAVNYTNCTFANGAYASSGKVTFDGCTFYRSHDKYSLWAYGDVDVVVQNSTFADYRGIKMYAEGVAKTVDLTVKNTDFSALDSKPAIVLTYGESVTLEGNTYSDTGVFELDLDGAPNGVAVTSDVAPTCKNDNGACGVLVDGKIYTTVAQAAEVATSGSTVTLLHDSTETVELAEGVTLDKNGYTADNVTVAEVIVYVAQVGDVKYTDIQEAIKAAAPAGTVELLCDVTVEEWTMIAERLSMADGSIITIVIDGLTIDGNGHTLTINSIESAGNGGYLFHGVSNINVQDLTIKVAEGFVGGISLKSGNIINVTFEGGTRAVMPGEGEVKIEGCTFKTNGHAIYYEEARNNLVVNNNTFELADNANVILLRGTEQFTNNTVVSGRTVNVVSGSPVVTGNNFGDVRLKVYNEATATISNNTINNLVFNDETVAGSVFADNTLSESAEAALEAVLPRHEHVWSDATCTEPSKCECGETQGEALGHTPGAEANCTTAQTCTVCGVELVAKLGHVDANLDVECDREGCTSKVAPKADSVLSTFTANCLGSKLSTSSKYYVIGTIVEVLDQKNGIFLVDDGTGEKFYFRLPKNADGVAHASWEVKLTLGDKVQLYGAINKYTSSSAPNGQYWPAMQGPVVTILEQHAHVANGAIVCTKDTLCACGTVVAPATGHIDADENGICDNCPWDMNLVEVNIAIGTDPKYNGVRVDDEAGKALSWTWSAGGFDAIISKGTSTVTLYTTAKDYMQLKKQNLLTIVNTEDVTVKYITISVTNATYLTHLKTALTNSGYEYTADETNFTATIQLNSTEDFVLENKSTSTVYVNGVTIVYAKKGAHVHEFKETITTPATCTEAGLKTFTCECGEGTYTEVIEALGHNFVEGVCSRCEEKDPNYVPPCAHKDTGLDAKCDVCGEYFLPTSPFKLEMYQASKKETYYFTGAMSGYYFASSTDITKAVDLYAEAVEGGYNVYFMSGSTKNYLYIEMSGTHINAKFGSTKAVWYVDAKYGSLTTELDGEKYFLGTYSSYVTFGGTAYSRLNDSTADISQYVGRAVSLADHVCEGTTVVTDPTCTTQGYTTLTCDVCGRATKSDYVDALGHDIVVDEAVAPTCTETGLTAGEHCSRCDHKVAQEVVEALGHSYEVAVTAPTCTSTGYTTYTCACGDTYVADEVAALEHEYVEGACTVCGKEDPNYVPHEHNFVEGKCECGETDPNYVPEQPPVEEPEEELNFFEKIIAWIVELFNKLIAMFKKN